MSKEIVLEIGKAIEEAQRAKDLRKKQETVKREAERFRLATEKQALIDRNEAKLRATGIVELFEELRDSNVLTNPAVIEWNSDRTEISIEFDWHECWDKGIPDPDGEGMCNAGWSEATNILKAAVLKNGTLQINGHEMRRGERLEIVVKDEILRLKGLKE